MKIRLNALHNKTGVIHEYYIEESRKDISPDEMLDYITDILSEKMFITFTDFHGYRNVLKIDDFSQFSFIEIA